MSCAVAHVVAGWCPNPLSAVRGITEIHTAGMHCFLAQGRNSVLLLAATPSVQHCNCAASVVCIAGTPAGKTEVSGGCPSALNTWWSSPPRQQTCLHSFKRTLLGAAFLASGPGTADLVIRFWACSCIPAVQEGTAPGGSLHSRVGITSLSSSTCRTLPGRHCPSSAVWASVNSPSRPDPCTDWKSPSPLLVHTNFARESFYLPGQPFQRGLVNEGAACSSIHARAAVRTWHNGRVQMQAHPWPSS